MNKKILNMIMFPGTLVFAWLLYLSSYIFGFLRYRNILLGNEDRLVRILFSGFWRLSFLFAAIFLLLLFIWGYFYLKTKIKRGNVIVTICIGISSIITFIVSNILINLEKINYNNFLYSKYGITKAGFELLSIISLISVIFLIVIILNRWKILKLERFIFSKNIIITLPFLGILFWYSLLLLINARGYLSYSRSTYENQFENHKEIMALKSNTDENASIILPSQSSKYPAISNPPIVRYFLFPRTIVSSTYLIDQSIAENFGSFYFITINKAGESVWPFIDKIQKHISFKDGTILEYSKLRKIAETDGEIIYEVEFNK